MRGQRPPSQLTLADVPVGARATLRGSQLPALRTRRLAELGLRPGAEVTVLLRTSGRGRVIALAEDRIALDGRTLHGLYVDRPSDGGAFDASSAADLDR
jgi:Fe2+ transport system protein FeoA